MFLCCGRGESGWGNGVSVPLSLRDVLEVPVLDGTGILLLYTSMVREWCDGVRQADLGVFAQR